jgi:hypothetical protein
LGCSARSCTFGPRYELQNAIYQFILDQCFHVSIRVWAARTIAAVGNQL